MKKFGKYTIGLHVLLVIFTIPKKIISQERSIQINISDTISLKPTLFVYQIDIGSVERNNYLDMDINNASTTSTEPSLATTLSITELEGVLKKEKFNYESINDKDYSISEYKNNNPTYTIKTKSEAELKKLWSAIKSIKGVTGKIKSVEYESPLAYETESYKRLYLKARAKAVIIALNSGVTVGDVMTITEMKEDEGSFYSYKALIKSMPYNSYGNDELGNSLYIKSYVYKFSIK